MKRAAVIVLALALLAAGPLRATLHGVVVAIDTRAGTALVRHDPFGGMPAMTMSFTVAPAELARLHPGDVIDAQAQAADAAWRLASVRIVATAAPQRYIPVLAAGDAVPDLPLVDQAGRRFSFQRLGSRVALVAFIYTRCPDPRMCPLVSAKFARLQRLIDPSTTRLVEVTLDPAFDTPAVLKRYGEAYGALADRWTFVTGSAAAVDELQRRLGIVSTPGDGGAILHTEALVVIDPAGRIAERVDGNAWTAEQAQALAQTALNERTNPLLRLGLALSSGVAALCGGGTAGITLAAAIGLFAAILAAIAFAFFRAFRAGHR
ncbi:MAG: SCO family protein [Candidatus Velthaea sp.]